MVLAARYTVDRIGSTNPPELAANADLAYNSSANGDRADVAELADAIDLGSIAQNGCGGSSPLVGTWADEGPWPSGKAPPLHGGDRRFESDRVHCVGPQSWTD